MQQIYEKADLSTNEGVLDFYKEMLNYRTLHKACSNEIARFSFDTTYVISSDVKIDERIKDIRYEFGALEAPGQPDDDMYEDGYVDSLWARLSGLVDKVRNEKRTA